MYRIMKDGVEVPQERVLRLRADAIRTVDQLFRENPSVSVWAETPSGRRFGEREAGGSTRVRPNQTSIDLASLPFEMKPVPGYTPTPYFRVRTKAVVFRSNDPAARMKYLVVTADGKRRQARDTIAARLITDELEDRRMRKVRAERERRTRRLNKLAPRAA